MIENCFVVFKGNFIIISAIIFKIIEKNMYVFYFYCCYTINTTSQ